MSLEAYRDGVLEEDVYWVFQMLSNVKDEDAAYEMAEHAPSPGAVGLLVYAVKYRKDFYANWLHKALGRSKQDGALKDDGRKHLDVFDQVRDKIHRDYLAERKCYACGRALTKHTILFPRPKKSQ